MEAPVFEKGYPSYNAVNGQNLLNRFNYLTEGMDDWKNPICARIPTEHFDEYNEACIHFTGTELQTMNTYPNGTSKVFAKGYYMMKGERK